MARFAKNTQYYKFCAYGFLKNLRFFEAFLVLFLIEKGLSFTQIGLLYALREVVTNLMEIPSGLLADTNGRRKTLAGSFLVYQASFLLFYLAEGWPLLILAFVLYGLGDAFRSGTHKGMIMDYLTKNGWSDQKINYYGHTRAWSHRGSALSALVAGGLVFFNGALDSVFLFALLPYSANFILLLSYPSWLDQPTKKASKTTYGQVFRSFWQAVKQPHVLHILNNSALHSAYLKALKDFIQPMIKSVALAAPLLLIYSPTQRTALFIGGIYALIYGLSAGASLLAGRWYALHTPGYRTTLVSLGIGLVAGLLCGWFFHLEWAVLALGLFVVVFLVENFRKPIMTGFAAEQVPSEVLTSVLSAQSLFKAILTGGIAIAVGLLADWVGLGAGIMWLSIGLLGITFIFSLRLPPSRQ